MSNYLTQLLDNIIIVCECITQHGFLLFPYSSQNTFDSKFCHFVLTFLFHIILAVKLVACVLSDFSS